MKQIVILLVLCTSMCIAGFAQNGDTTTTQRKVVSGGKTFTIVSKSFEQWGCWGKLPNGVSEALYTASGELIFEPNTTSNCRGCSQNDKIKSLTLDNNQLTVESSEGETIFIYLNGTWNQIVKQKN